MNTRAPIVFANQSPLAGVNVLFVDAASDERALFEERFGADCSRLAAVSCVAEALAVLERGETELVVTEVRLPNRDAYDLIRDMRSSPAEQAGAVPILAATTWSARDDEVGALRRWFDGYVFKPYEPEAVLSAVADASPAIAALRRLRARNGTALADHRELRARAASVGTGARASEVSVMTNETGTVATSARARIVPAARRFAELYFSRPVDALEIASSVLLDEERESWVVAARADLRLLLVEVVVGPGDRVVTRRLDTGENGPA